ncbi:MAG: 3-phosphoshikimate 1-carboxyvinyltransferase, partial [Candidatus Rokubacteria bacterium]|nr:3-phosphoshikimate 1-carboxyvinyltransferase [Candidatus Rokubacteria bacterium]
MNFRVRPVARLAGTNEVPGDKSISHRAALLGALADGVTEVRGYLEAEDCLRTMTAIEALGADVTRKAPGEFRIAGVGSRGLQEAADVIDCGNSGTTARLLLGVLGAQRFWTFLTGDASLRRRPMGRVAEPLRRMGATVVGRAEGTRLPLAVCGAERVKALAWELPVASAQVKSAILLAGLAADGPVTVTEPAPSRDHSERMLRQFGARVETTGRTIRITPGPLRGTAVTVPGDISSAAFLVVAGLIVRDAQVTVRGVGLNPTRTGLLDVLSAMGARLAVAQTNAADGGEPLGTIAATTNVLTGTTVAGPLIPRLIDEVPVLAVAAALARGVTEIRDAAELRVKESDRVAAIARELGALGARIAERPDGLTVEGGARLRGARV